MKAYLNGTLKKDFPIDMIARAEGLNLIGDMALSVKKDETLFDKTYNEIYEELNKNGYIEL